MGTTIGAAELDIVPSVSGFKKKLDSQLRPQMKKSGTKAGGLLGSGLAGGIKKHLVGIGASIAAAFAVKKVITSSINAFKDWTLGVIQMKRVAGGSVVGVSRLRFAMQESGVDTTKATTALGIFAKKLGTTNGDAKKTKAMTDLLGFSYRNAAGHIKPLTVLLPKLADKFKRMPDGPEKSALAMQLFGKSGRDLLPFLNKGSAGIADLRKESDRLGLTLSQKAVDKFAAYKSATREWDASLQGLRVSLGGAILPSLTRFNQFLTRNVGPGVEKLRLWVKTSPDVKQASRDVSLGLANVAKFTRKDVVPALSDFVQGMHDGTGAGGALAGSLRNLLGVGRGVVNIFRATPAPVSKTVLKIALAAVAVNRLQKAINAVKTSAFVSSMTAAAVATETEGVAAATTSGRMAMLGGAAKAAAGVGGMLLLMDASNRTSKSMGFLEGAAGGAATGFAVGGPWGAAIGGAAGGLLGLASSGNKANDVVGNVGDQATKQVPGLDGLRASLNKVTGAYTGMSKAVVTHALEPSFPLAKQLNISARDLIAAQLGNIRAQKRVQAAIDKAQFNGGLSKNDTLLSEKDRKYTDYQRAQLDALSAAAYQLQANLQKVTHTKQADTAATRAYALATRALTKLYPTLPKSIITKIGQQGGAETLGQIKLLASKIKLTPAQIKVLLSTANLPATLADIRAVNAAADHAARERQLTVRITSSGKFPDLGGGQRNNDGTIDHDGNPKTGHGRMLGGRVRKNTAYVVGERRPELFVPDQSGRIEPRVNVRQSAGGGTATLERVYVPTSFTVDDIEFGAYIDAKIDDRMNP